MIAATGRAALVAALAFVTACAAPGANSKKKPSVKEAEAALARMFSDSSGKAELACTAGDGRHD